MLEAYEQNVTAEDLDGILLNQQSSRAIMEMIIECWLNDEDVDWQTLIGVYRQIRERFPLLASHYDTLDDDIQEFLDSKRDG